MLNTTTVTFAGNLAADPELRFTPNGKPVAEFRVLVNRRSKDEAGEWTDTEPTVHPCKVWGTAAENVAESLTRGDRVLVHGRIETEGWSDRETGDKRTRDIVNIDEIGPSLTWATARPERNQRPSNKHDN